MQRPSGSDRLARLRPMAGGRWRRASGSHRLPPGRPRPTPVLATRPMPVDGSSRAAGVRRRRAAGRRTRSSRRRPSARHRRGGPALHAGRARTRTAGAGAPGRSVAMPVAADGSATRPTPAADAPTVGPVAVRSGPAAEPGGPTPGQTATRILEPTWTVRRAGDAIGRTDQGPEGRARSRPGRRRSSDGDRVEESSSAAARHGPRRHGRRTADRMASGRRGPIGGPGQPARWSRGPRSTACGPRTSARRTEPPAKRAPAGGSAPAPVPTDMGSLGTVVHIGSIEIRAGRAGRDRGPAAAGPAGADLHRLRRPWSRRLRRLRRAPGVSPLGALT